MFLVLFSYVLLCDFRKVGQADPNTSLGLAISIPEIVLIIWVVTFALDEFRQVYRIKKIFRIFLLVFIFTIYYQTFKVSYR